MSDYPEAAKPLKLMEPESPYFVGIDSDGCVFDTMEIKHKECFCPNIIRFWGLQAVSKYARETVEFVNLYSKWRGVNRWPALVLALDLLRDRPEVTRRLPEVPGLPHVRAFVNSGEAQSNDGLRRFMESNPSAELEHALAWSEAVNASIAEMVYGVPPFPFFRECLEMMRQQADLVVVSGTPTEALTREWREHAIDRSVRAIAGQEMGKKSLHLQLATSGKYAADRILMIGDAPGDLKAARANQALFFPVVPGQEEKSWERLYEEGFARFLEGTFRGDYEDRLVAEFESRLPENPPWRAPGNPGNA